MSKKTLEQLKNVTYNSALTTVTELLRARLALSIYSEAKTARLQVNFVFPQEFIPMVEDDLQCKVKVSYCFYSTAEEPHATIFTIKL